MEFFKSAKTGESRKDMLFGKALEYVKSQNWKYSVIGSGKDIIELQMGLKGRLNSCRMIITAGEKEIQAYAFAPIKATPDCYANVVEFITRANYGLKIGSFEFDYRDGEVRYHSCLPCQEGVPSLKDIEITVDVTMLMLQRYGDGLVKNLMGFGDPERDVAAMEEK